MKSSTYVYIDSTRDGMRNRNNKREKQSDADTNTDTDTDFRTRKRTTTTTAGTILFLYGNRFATFELNRGRE